MIKAVIFDLDGVICSTDQYHYQAWKQTADYLGVYFDEVVNERLRGVSRMDSLEIILEKSDKSYSLEEKEKIAEYKKEIENYILKKTNIVGENSKAGSYLNNLIQERKNYENQLNSGSEYIKAPMSGVVSYKVDGLEDVLTPDDFSSYNRSFFEGLNLKTGQTVATNTECGKVVNNYECYIATIIKKEQLHDIEQGDKLNLRLSNGDEISSSVEYAMEQTDDDVLVVFKISKDVEKLISNRKISFDIIFWQYSGYKVPNTAIIKENDLAYVVRNRAGYLTRVLVKVEKENDSYSIIDNYSSDELKEMGYNSSELNVSTKINMYDEIQTIANPEIK